MRITLGVLVLLFIYAEKCAGDEEEKARIFMRDFNEREGIRNNEASISQWKYASNITDENLKEKLDVSKRLAKERKEEWKNIVAFDWRQFKDADLKRQFWMNSDLGSAILSDEKYERLQNVIASMQSTYATSKICDFYNKTKCDLAYEPELVTLLSKSNNPEELKHIWVEWRKATGTTKQLYKEYVDLLNEAATLNNFTNAGEHWLQYYEDPNFREEIAKLWSQLKPLYEQIHAYVRTQLIKKYGPEVVPERGPLPAHLLGNMWAQTWDHIGGFTLPFPQKEEDDPTEEMVKQGYTAEKLFKVSEEFFTSIGMIPMTDTFWKKSILEKPKDGRELVCHASAWDFYDGDDFRIKQCTKITLEDLATAHHEMGHIQYYLQYRNQPVAYRGGANPGFHEAVGDTLTLSATTKKHLKKIGLAKNADTDFESTINDLYLKAIGKIVFPPFAYVMDLWRWDVFSGKTTENNYNSLWWKLRQEVQGIAPPVDRSENDFDPAAKYHTVASVPYIRYFVSYIVQFQFHRTLCQIAGEFDPQDPSKPLHNCDIFGNKEAGAAMSKMLALGSSKPWQDAMEVLTGQRAMDASGILDYFKPLQTWLESENKKSGAFIGWEAQGDFKKAYSKTKKLVS